MSIIGAAAVLPDQIDPTQHLFDAFDHNETEVSAGWLVRFAQQRGKGWEPFTADDIEAYYQQGGFRGFSFNRLIHPGRAFDIQAGYRDAGGGWIVEDDSKLHFTHEFAERCYRSRPAEARGEAR